MLAMANQRGLGIQNENLGIRDLGEVEEFRNWKKRREKLQIDEEETSASDDYQEVRRIGAGRRRRIEKRNQRWDRWLRYHDRRKQKREFLFLIE